MNTVNTPSRLAGLIASGVFGALALSSGAVCSAADGFGSPQVLVKYGDLNVSSQQGAVALYTRIRAAAERVCGPFDHRDLAAKTVVNACIHKAISDAVAKVDQPALSAVYRAKNRTPQPIILAVGQTR